MNYQKFFSRFYSSGEQPNGELLQKYVVFSGNNEQTNVNAGTSSENTDFIEIQQQIVDQEDKFLNRNVSEEIPTWNVPSPEETTLSVEPLSSEEVRWFYKAKDDKMWSEFNGYDSLLLEDKYRLLPPAQRRDDSVQSHVTAPHEEFVSELKTSHSDETKSEVKSKDDYGEFSPRRFLRFNQKTESLNTSGVERLSVKSDSESSEDSWDENVTVDVDRDKIVVRGGLYEVDLVKMTCESIYWPGEKYAITRGLYFYDGSWQPLERCHGEVIETEHLRLFGTSADNKSGPPSTGIAVHRQDFPDFHIEWMSRSEIYLYWGGAPRQLVRSVTQKLGFYQSTGYRLRRGYRTRATLMEKPSDITHVVFVIHGIGHKIDEGRIIRNTNTLRSICEWLRLHHPVGNEGRAELFPAKWRAGARGRASGLLSAAAPPGALALRRAINDAAMDVMYYTSPLYGKQIQDDLRRELNRLYTMFMARNPNYKGQFSAVAHSLGSVILYDLIINYQIGCEHCSGPWNPQKQKLLFPLEHMFCIGSPLGVFLTLRHPDPSLSAVLPNEFTPRLYNIFHSSDPVAYRLEPLISPFNVNQPPVVIPSYDASPTNPVSSPARSSWKIWSYVKHPWQKPSDDSISKNISEMEMPSNSRDNSKVEDSVVISHEEEVTITQSDSETSQLKPSQCCSHRLIKAIVRKESLMNKPLEEPQKEIVEYKNVLNNEHSKVQVSEDLKNDKNTVIKVEESIFIVDQQKEIDVTTERKKSVEFKCEEVLPYRLDYTLRDTGMASNYLSAITSHTSYWNNYDVAQFIISSLTGSDDVFENKDINET